MSFPDREAPEPGFPQAGGLPQDSLETRLRKAASAFAYPVTPDLAARERRRLSQPASTPARGRRAAPAFGWVLLALVVLLAGLLLVSPARARVLDWIRIGAVRIFFTQPTAPPLPPTATPAAPGKASAPTSLPPVPTATPMQSVLDLAGETTLAKAQEQASFTIQMPTYPPDLGPPEHVYFQRLGGQPVIILAWMVPGQPDTVRLSLSEASSEQMMFEKYARKSVRETRVGSYPAVWVDGEYLLVMRNGETSLTRLVNQGHTLIWNTGKMTFRLETDADLATALRMAESLRETGR